MFKKVFSGIGKSELKFMSWKSDFLSSGLDIRSQNCPLESESQRNLDSPEFLFNMAQPFITIERKLCIATFIIHLVCFSLQNEKCDVTPSTEF